MNDRLDHLLERLAATPTDCPLDAFEAGVSRGIVQRRSQARTAMALAPVRFASIGLALAMGVTVGGLTVATARQPAGFSSAVDLAPSTLLEDGR